MLIAVPRRRIAAAVFTASALLLLTACSGGSGDASTPSEGGRDGGGGAAFTAYRDCLSKNGVTLPSTEARPSGQPRTRPSGFPDGVRPSGFPDGVRPSGFPDGARPSGFPDGVRPSGGVRQGGGGLGFGMQKPEGVDDATWQKAQQACASVLPSGRPQRSDGQNSPGGAYQNCLNDHGGANAKEAQTACAVLSPSPSR